MIAHHFGTDGLPRQCVTLAIMFFMKAGHILPQQTIILKSENYIFNNLTTKTFITDRMIKVFLGRDGFTCKGGVMVMTKKIKMCLPQLCKKTLKKAKLLKNASLHARDFIKRRTEENVAVKLVPKKTRWHMNFN